MCNKQKIKQTDFKNFCGPGFISLATIGGILMVVPWLAIQANLRLGRRRLWPFVLDWISYGELQLLCMAIKGAGVQRWKGCDEEVPFTDTDETGNAIGQTSMHSSPVTRLLDPE